MKLDSFTVVVLVCMAFVLIVTVLFVTAMLRSRPKSKAPHKGESE